MALVTATACLEDSPEAAGRMSPVSKRERFPRPEDGASSQITAYPTTEPSAGLSVCNRDISRRCSHVLDNCGI